VLGIFFVLAFVSERERRRGAKMVGVGSMATGISGEEIGENRLTRKGRAYWVRFQGELRDTESKLMSLRKRSERSRG
jgi:hypothetical protein